MVWTTWRQHRGEALVLGLLLGVLAAAVLATGTTLRNAFVDQGIAGCLAAAPPPTCQGVVGSYEQQFQTVFSLYQWLNLFPLVLGIFVGAPLVAREVERSTNLLAWTQEVTRTRWIVTKVIVLVAVAAAVGAAFTLLMTWWRQPLDAIAGGAIQPEAFDLEGLVPVGYFVLALSIGIAAGTLVRRTVPAMAVAIVAFLAMRFGTIGLLRPHYMAALVSSGTPGGSPPPGTSGAWVLSDRLVQADGTVLTGRFPLDHLCPGDAAKESVATCLHQHGVLESIVYQPADRFWAFQAIELCLFLGVAVALLGVTIAWVRSRIS